MNRWWQAVGKFDHLCTVAKNVSVRDAKELLDAIEKTAVDITIHECFGNRDEMEGYNAAMEKIREVLNGGS
jgi:hypothetical protein